MITAPVTDRSFGTRLRHTMRATVVGMMAAAAFAPQTVFAQTLEIRDKTELNALIREYLLSNPEVLIEVQEALEVRQAERQREIARATVVEEADALFRSPVDAVYGNPDGDVTLVEFFDYNCPFCRRSMEDIEALIADDPGLRVVVKEWPIFGPDSVGASLVSKAVGAVHPGRYREFHNRLMRSDERKTGELAMELVRTMELDEAAITDLVASEAAYPDFENTNRLAGLIGANGTPTYVIGDEIVHGAMGQATLAEAIERTRD